MDVYHKYSLPNFAFGYVFLRQFKGHKLPPPEFKAVGYVDAEKSPNVDAISHVSNRGDAHRVFLG